MKACIIFADAELEPVPAGPKEAICCISQQPFRDVPVLDSFFHSSLLKGLPEGERRGRPDIVHQCLLLCQNSIPNHRGLLNIFVHTRHDQVIAVEPSADVPPNYFEFLQQMGALLGGTAIPGYALSVKTFQELIGEIKANHIMALTPTGEEKALPSLLGRPGKDDRVVIIIGAFPNGDYHSPVYVLADTQVSLGPWELTPPVVVGEVLAALPGQ